MDLVIRRLERRAAAGEPVREALWHAYHRAGVLPAGPLHDHPLTRVEAVRVELRKAERSAAPLDEEQKTALVIAREAVEHAADDRWQDAWIWIQEALRRDRYARTWGRGVIESLADVIALILDSLTRDEEEERWAQIAEESARG